AGDPRRRSGERQRTLVRAHPDPVRIPARRRLQQFRDRAGRRDPFSHDYDDTSRCGRHETAAGSRQAVADPPGAQPGHEQGEGQVDHRFIPLEGPEAAGGLVGHLLPVSEAGWPAALTVCWELTQAPGLSTVTVRSLSRLMLRKSPEVMVMVSRSGGMRCGRTATDMVIWVTAKRARRMDIAGSVRRVMTPMVTPRTKKKAA